MQVLIVLSALVAVSFAFVCLPNACDNIEKPLLNCKGEINVGTGWCGCTDSCAILEGETCVHSTSFSINNNQQCATGLVCKSVLESPMFSGVCVNKTIADTFVSKRMVCPPNVCDNVEQETLNCAGGMTSTGFCGCTKRCLKQKGESCGMSQFSALLGVPSVEDKCDTGLECTHHNLEGFSSFTCMDPTETNEDVLMSKRQEMVCPEGACANYKKEVLNCQGGLLKGFGWCGCSDVCAKVRGEECISEDSPFLLMDVGNDQTCDEGLVCHQAYEGKSICLMANETSAFVSKRATNKCDTACRRKTQMCTFSFVIYPGQWFARCDMEGNFLSEQCNNKGECFCVDNEGTIDESTRVSGSLGSANCA